MFNSGTQRTAMALELARLSSGFVALTGTPIVDSKAYSLMTWLELVVPFEVNKRNFWVAANSMVAKLVATGVIVQREEVEVPMSPSQLKRYQGLVQPRHGGAERSNASEYSYHDAATLGYEVCEAAMVSKTVEIITRSKHQPRLDPGLRRGATVRFQCGDDESFQLGKISNNGEVIPLFGPNLLVSPPVLDASHPQPHPYPRSPLTVEQRHCVRQECSRKRVQSEFTSRASI